MAKKKKVTEEVTKVDLSKKATPEDNVTKVNLDKPIENETKDERTRIQASQQSELIDQRKGAKPPKNFESAGNDILGSGFDLGSFDPR